MFSQRKCELNIRLRPTFEILTHIESCRQHPRVEAFVPYFAINLWEP